jgi:hypothetical protein
MNNRRLERILLKLAQQREPQLVMPGWEQSPNALKRLARSLADYNLLVIMGNVPAHLIGEKDRHIQNWVNTYARFHNLLAQTLFPNYSALEARFADEHHPVIVVIEARISPVLEAMAGYLVPFVASRQPYTRVMESELHDLMEFILSRLAVDDLSSPIFNTLVQDGIKNVRRLLEQPVQHIALTDFDRRIFEEIPKPVTLPTATTTREMPAVAATPAPQPAPSEPEIQEMKLETLEEIAASPLTPTERMFVRPVNLTFDRTPPVPGLPGQQASRERKPPIETPPNK